MAGAVRNRKRKNEGGTSGARKARNGAEVSLRAPNGKALGALRWRLTWAGAERASGKGAGAHAEARSERRRNGAQEVAAGRAAAIVGDGAGGVGAQPVAAQFAKRIDALHGVAGQILHARSLSGRQLRGGTGEPCGRSSPGHPSEMMAGIVALKRIGVKRKGPLDIVAGLR